MLTGKNNDKSGGTGTGVVRVDTVVDDVIRRMTDIELNLLDDLVGILARIEDEAASGWVSPTETLRGVVISLEQVIDATNNDVCQLDFDNNWVELIAEIDDLKVVLSEKEFLTKDCLNAGKWVLNKLSKTPIEEADLAVKKYLQYVYYGKLLFIIYYIMDKFDIDVDVVEEFDDDDCYDDFDFDDGGFDGFGCGS